jgi:hypothetical protein
VRLDGNRCSSRSVRSHNDDYSDALQTTLISRRPPDDLDFDLDLKMSIDTAHARTEAVTDQTNAPTNDSRYDARYDATTTTTPALVELVFAPGRPRLLTGLVGLFGVVGDLHAVVAQDLEQLVAERRDVLLDLVEVVLRHALSVVAALPSHDVALDEVTHHRLQGTARGGGILYNGKYSAGV